MCPPGAVYAEFICGISSPPALLQAIIFYHLTRSLWSGDVLTCKVRSRGWCGGSDYVGLWPGEESWRGLELRSGQPGACWADGIERGNKPSNSCGSQLLGLQQTLHSHLPPIPLRTVNICSDPLWRGAKETVGSSTMGLRRQKKCVFVFWEVSQGRWWQDL